MLAFAAVFGRSVAFALRFCVGCGWCWWHYYRFLRAGRCRFRYGISFVLLFAFFSSLQSGGVFFLFIYSYSCCASFTISSYKSCDV